METKSFDAIATTLARTNSRRGALRFLAAAALGAAGLATVAGEDADAKRKRKKKGGRDRGGDGNGGRDRPRDMCPVSRPAPNSPTCGDGADGEACTCTRATEGNNICVGFIDSCEALVECNSTRDCRDSVGFHYFCQAAGTGSCGQRCVPECDNTDPF